MLKTGLASELLLNIVNYYTPGIIDDFFFKYIIIIILLIVSVFVLIYCFSIKINLFRVGFSHLYNLGLLIIIQPLKLFKFFSRKNKEKGVKRYKIKNEPTISKKTKFFGSSNKLNKKQNISTRDNNKYTYNLPDVSYLIKSTTKNADVKELDKFNKINVEKLPVNPILSIICMRIK